VCGGIVAQHTLNLALKVFPADAVVLCTGGFENIYARYAGASTGYAVAQAYLQGATFANPEFVQFEETKPMWSLGGLWVDDNHQTSIPGLFAAGGCAARYHGASALMPNVPLAVVHGGECAGASAVEWVQGREVRGHALSASLVKEAERVQEYEQDKFFAMSGYENPHKLKQELGELLQTHAGVTRQQRSLEAALEKIVSLRDRFWQSGILDHARWANQELVFMRQLSRELELAHILVAAALKREESRGMHQRSDHPERNDTTWKCLTKVTYDEEKPVFDFRERISDA
ncbi:MAG: FAD-binding protein, partial [Deltaproteobacteria bacterium]|nr:FAD-binding protein [Deltaproteobacteria bacterium]